MRYRQRVFLSLVLVLLTLVLLLSASVWRDGDMSPQTAPLLAEETLKPVGHFGGWMGALATAGGDYLYMGRGNGLDVLDVSDPAQPQPVGGLPLSGWDVGDLALAGTNAYAVNGKGLRVIDITHPETPTLVGEFDLSTFAGALDVAGSYAYVLTGSGYPDYNGQMHILDVSDPTSPNEVGVYDNLSYVRGIQVVGGVAYVADGTSGFRILNVSNPASPTLLGSYDTPGDAQSVQVVGSVAYVADGSSGLQILDVSDPASPTLLGSYDTPGYASQVQVQGATVYVADGGQGLLILDVSDSTQPTLLGSKSDVTAEVLVLSGNHAYVGSGGSLYIVDVSDPASPTALGDSSWPAETKDFFIPAASASTAALQQNGGPYGYVIDDGNLWIVGLSNPALPAPMGHASLTHGSSESLFVAGGRAYVVEGSGGVEIFDVTNPASPQSLGLFPKPSYASWIADVFVSGQYAYVVGSRRITPPQGWLSIVDISDPTNPSEVAVFDTSGQAQRVFVSNSMAYIAADDAGLLLIDVSTPTAPVEVGSLAPPQGTKSEAIYVEGSEAYLGSNGSSGAWVQKINVSDPAHPVVMTTHQSPAPAQVRDIQVAGDYVYAAAEGGSLWLLSRDWMMMAAMLHSESSRRLALLYLGGMTTYAYLTGYSGGAEIIEKEIGGGGGGSECSIVGKVEPPKAKTDGSRVIPPEKQCQCGVEQVNFTAEAGSGWEFDSFNPEPPMQCPDSGQAEIVATFSPILIVAGKGEAFLCAKGEEKVKTVLNFSLTASEADSWQVSKFTFGASGSGDDKQDIKAVRLYRGGSQLGGDQTYGADDGTVTFSFPAVLIPAGSTVSFRLEYEFDFENMADCATASRKYGVSLKSHNAEAKNYPPGHALGAAQGGAQISCVFHEKPNGDFDQGFDDIQSAVDAATAGTVIAVCPGTFEENVDVTESVTIHSVSSRSDTFVLAADSNSPVFHVRKDNTVIDGFTVEKATGSGQAGVYVHGSVVKSARVVNNLITSNDHGVLLDSAQEAEVSNNIISHNNAHGLYLKSSTGSRIEDNSISNNGEDGIFFYFSQETGSAESLVKRNNVRENGKNGIHLQHSRGVKIEDNVSINENTQHGIFLDASDTVRIINNPFIEGNEMDGIRLNDSSGVEIRGNQNIKENTERGISIYNSVLVGNESPNQIMGNTIFGNRPAGKQKVGIYVNGSTEVEIGTTDSPNTIRSHTENGISLVNSALRNKIAGNTIRLNNGNGIYVNASCKNRIEGNTIGEENGDGIEFDHVQCSLTAANQVVDNAIRQNVQSGVLIHASYGNKIGVEGAPNVIEKNGKDGVKLEEAKAPAGEENIIAGNTIRENGQHGVYLVNSNFNIVGEGNRIGPNDEDGIYIRSSEENTVHNNEIDGNDAQENGVHLQFSHSALIEGNKIKRHTGRGILVENGGFGDSSIRIADNSIQDNVTGVYALESCKVWVGIWNDGGDPLFMANTIGPNRQEGVRLEGATCSANQKNWIAHNTLEKNQVGVWVQNSENARIGEQNQIKSNTTDGVYVFRSTRVEIAGNTIGPANQNGIHVVQSEAALGAENKIMSNTIKENKTHGVLIERSYGVLIGSAGEPPNSIKGNSGNGIHVIRSSSSTSHPAISIIGNYVSEDNTHGIYLWESDNNLIENNTVADNKKDGIHLTSSDKNKIRENGQVDTNGWYGISLKWSEENEITGNGVGWNEMGGVFLYESNNNRIPGLKQKANTITENKEDGIRLDASHYNAIYDNEITKNKRDGIRLNYSRKNEIVGALKIEENEGNGILLDGSIQNKIEGPFFKSIKGRVKWQAWTYKNGKYGIHFRNSPYNSLTRYKIYKHSVGILIEANSNYNKFTDNLISVNGVGVREYNSHGNNYGTSIFQINGLAVVKPRSDSADALRATGVGQADSQTYLTGCTITGSDTDGVRTDYGAGFTIRKCHIYDNGGAGVNNLDPSVAISAQDNWWGDSSGPGGEGPGSGEEISGTVDFAPWRTEPITLTVVPLEDSVFAARGSTGSTYVFAQNRETLSDTVTVTLTDTQDWLLPPTTFTITLNGPSAGIPVSFTVPAGATIGVTDTVTVTVDSQSNPALTDTDSFQIITTLVADLSVEHVVSADPATINQGLTYTVAVTNNGPDGATGVTLVDTLPADVTFGRVEPSQGSCGETDGTVTCTLDAIGNNQVVTVTVEVTPTTLGVILNVVDVVGNEYDPNPAINVASYAAVETRMYLPVLTHN